MRTALVAALLVLPALAAIPANAAPATFDATVTSFDGHRVPIRVYLADAPGTSPTLLWGHGWAGSRDDSATYGQFFAANGYNVVAMDFRGHGAARTTSAARVHDVDYEVKDVIAVIDWVATQEWAALDAAGDPTLGALGGSYGGGYQLLTAAFDDRLDALAPEITWNDLPQSLAPNGGLKSGWLDLLYWGGNARANLDPFIHQGYAWGMATNELPRGQVPGVPDVIAQFERSSPKNHVIDAPALIIQGAPDTLFNLNQAFANVAQLHAAGADVKLLTHQGGHIINTVGTIPGGLPATGLQPAAAPSPCGDVKRHILAWYDHKLKGAADTVPDVQLGLADGSCAVLADAYAGAATTFWTDAATALPATMVVTQASASTSANVLGRSSPDSALAATILEPASGVLLAGIPTLDATVTVATGDAILYFAIAIDGVQVNSQVTPVRLGVGTHQVDVDLGGIVERAPAGSDVSLQVALCDAQFVHNCGRGPAVVLLEDVTVTLPVVG